jgi:hypothetical protein
MVYRDSALRPVKTITLRNLGRFGNQMFRYAFTRALAEQNGWGLRTEPWVGEKIFTLDGSPHDRPKGNEYAVIDEYRQAQKDLIYSRADCRRWFKLKPEIEDRIMNYAYALRRSEFVLCHFRDGDYKSAGYPVVSRLAHERAVAASGYDPAKILWVDERQPFNDPYFDQIGSFVPDFLRMTIAPVLFRANSSFSYWAAVLGTGRVFSPIITGFRGGEEHDTIPYVEGNWPRLAELEFVTDLHLRET